MIELLLYFTLGFLCAAFLAALVAPAVWRRAVMLTRRRIEASVPLTLDEIRADKDSLKAEHAVIARRLEMDVKSLKAKASEQSIKLARERKDVKAIAAEREASKAELARIEGESRAVRDELRRKDDSIQALSMALTRTEEMLQALRADFAKLGKEYEEASFSSSARQIEIVARESEIDRLNSDIVALKGQRKSIERASQNAGSAVNIAQETVAAEKQRVAALDAKLSKLMSDLTDREEKLERRDREVARLRERLKPILAAPLSADGDLRLIDLQAENMRLEARLAEMTQRLSTEPATADEATSSDKQDRLEKRVVTLVRENKALREKMTAPESKEQTLASHHLREQMQALAAEVVHLTAMVEGPGSPIDLALAKPNPEPGMDGDAPLSLADRIIALRKRSTSPP